MKNLDHETEVSKCGNVVRSMQIHTVDSLLSTCSELSPGPPRRRCCRSILGEKRLSPVENQRLTHGVWIKSMRVQE